MNAPGLEELAFVDAVEALRRHFEGANYRRARWLWLILVFVSFACLASSATLGSLYAVVGGASLAALVALVPLRRRSAFRRNFSVLLFAGLVVESLTWIGLAGEEGLATGYALAFVCPVLLLLRLRGSELLTLAAVNVGGVALRWLALPAFPDGEPRSSLGSFVAVTVASLLCAGIGWSITQRARQEFLVSWRQTAARERERLRMREEIHDARAIQLAMLPTFAPSTTGLDVAGVCVPATEVGGDYYDYFADGEGALGVAIGDVAGHGVASGLVLAGVRAGLHLLAPEIARSPASVLARLNAIVAGPGGQRLLMTLGLARFDRSRRAASWVAAGHPPPLRWVAAERRVEPLSTAHPPLGTKLPIRLEVVERPFDSGDVWLLVSDGAIEARDERGREFGEGRLEPTFERLAAREESAGAILDGMLAELARFRGGQPQDDDLTLVVVRAATPA
jgi:hypothetical protein